jgi:di/tricarboxylate transporter
MSSWLSPVNGDQLIIIAVLAAAMGLFLWGRWRHDLVAMAALLACLIAGLIPPGEVFSGFGHPAVITVAAVLILGYGLQITGAVNALARRLLPSAGAGTTLSLLALVGLGAGLSCFMNNVGALALLMPVAIQMAGKHDLPPGKFLMPLAFGSILGGMTTLIGTPPNLIVSGFRSSAGLDHFGMFDFTPVGLTAAAVGVLFIGLAGWRLVPVRKEAESDSFETGNYLSEVRVEKGSKVDGQSLREAEKLLDEAGGQIVGLVRGGVRLPAPNRRRILRTGDILVVEVEPEALADALAGLGLKLEGEGKGEEKEKEAQARRGKDEDEEARAEEIVIREMVVTPNAPLVNRSAADIRMRTRFGINLLAVSREGRRSVKRLRAIKIRAGDLLLLQGPPEAVAGFASEFGCLPLAARDIRVPKKGQALIAALIMAAAAAAATLGLLPAAAAFAAGALVMLLTRIIPARGVYSAIDWPVIVLLGAMLPVAGAMGATGAADTIARFLLENLASGNAVFALILLMTATTVFSNLMNNAATAAVMCPIAISAAGSLGVNPDAFLMAVAVGASCAFLTPIGHQNNTLILGPGGFRFGDYWRPGLAVTVLVLTAAVPMILWVWPL